MRECSLSGSTIQPKLIISLFRFTPVCTELNTCMKRPQTIKRKCAVSERLGLIGASEASAELCDVPHGFDPCAPGTCQTRKRRCETTLERWRRPISRSVGGRKSSCQSEHCTRQPDRPGPEQRRDAKNSAGQLESDCTWGDVASSLETAAFIFVRLVKMKVAHIVTHARRRCPHRVAPRRSAAPFTPFQSKSQTLMGSRNLRNDD